MSGKKPDNNTGKSLEIRGSGPSRRSFLKGAAGGAMAAPLIAGTAAAEVIRSNGVQPAGTVLPDRAVGRPLPGGFSFPEEAVSIPKDGRRVGFAVVGLGSFALNQMIPALMRTDHCRLAAVVTGNPEKGAGIARTYGLPEDAIYSYERFDEIANDDRVDVVYIVLPTGLHAEWTKKAFAAGKHVLVEKCMATSPAECEEMIAASEAAAKKLMVAYRVHFEPYNMKAKELIRGGEIGMPRMLNTTNHRVANLSNPSDVWRLDRSLAGGGALPDYGIYGLNGMQYFLGEQPVEVSARITTPADDPRFLEVEDHVSALLTFPSGAMGNLSTSYNTENSNTIDVYGTEGRVSMDPATFYGGNTLTLRRGRSAEQLNPGNSSVQFAAELDHMASAVLDDTPIITPGEMGLRDCRIIEAIYTSAREGRPVKLNPDATMAN
ncbi:Gfo/Idh/MocA family oxidoreductase [Parvularcula flava]|uniref:Gfo/Idh/MocA family oxidoreductase n=1 Tax=Aquisalinus luteolus TaxID=1566827 RepID=A0A8J3A2I9_9PROT|nr:Gfo/Idh/MocA family oxidoreductase [Aquisalinus luteolus]NHK28336.1 Gfo/Idh/MocA family oxidoreductase [Aquisalinus luteolus]GGH98169.1 glucose-fructose oxidoreductase [Aquisalinus luteolus]